MSNSNTAFTALAFNNLYGGSYSNVGRYYGGSPYAGYGSSSLLNSMGIGLGSQQMRYNNLPGAYGLGFGGGGLGGGIGGLGAGLGGMMIGLAVSQMVVGLLGAFSGGGRDDDDCNTCSRQHGNYNNNFGNYSDINENFDNNFHVNF